MCDAAIASVSFTEEGKFPGISMLASNEILAASDFGTRWHRSCF